MPRPKKVVDTKLILKLHAEGLSSYKIAEQLKESQATVWRVIHNSKRVIQNDSTSRKSKVIQNKTSNSKPIQNSSDVNGDSCKNPPLTSKTVPSSTTPTRSAPLGTTTTRASLHRKGFGCDYEGTQPKSLNSHPYGFRKNNRCDEFEFNNCTIQMHKHRAVVWPHGIKGNTVAELEKNAEQAAHDAMKAFAEQYGLKINWKTFLPLTEAEYNLEPGPENEAVKTILRTNPERAKSELKGKPGDSTHPDQAEFHDKQVFEKLLKALDAADDLAELKETIKELAKNQIIMAQVQSNESDNLKKLTEGMSMMVKHQKIFENMTHEQVLWLGGQIGNLTKILAEKHDNKLMRET